MNELEKLISDKRVNNHMMSMWLRDIDSKNLVCALLRTDDTTKKKIFNCVSKNTRKQLETNIEYLKETATEEQISYSLSLLARAMTKLLEQGEIRDRPLPPKEMPDVNIENESEIIDTFFRLAKRARIYGLLSLEGIQEGISDPVLGKGLRYIIDGMDPFEVQKLLENNKKSYLYAVDRRLNMLIEGVLAIQRNDDPSMIAEMLESYL